MEILDISETLAWNSNGSRWPLRKMNKIKQIVIHQSLGTKTVYDTNAYCIRNSDDMSAGRSMPKVPYHFFIHPDGHIFQANKFTDLTTHVKNMNTISLGVCLGGFYNYDDVKGRDGDPPVEQMEALEWLLVYLTDLLKLTNKNIYTHKILQNKNSCPGNVAEAFVTKINENGFTK